MIRATQGNSANLGVDEDALPIDEEVLYVAHGTSLKAARSIVLEGIDPGERLHVHFRECTPNGHLLDDISMRQHTKVVIAVSAAHAREEGIVFHRSTNDVVLSAGIDGTIPPRFNRCVLEYPSLRALRDHKSH